MMLKVKERAESEIAQTLRAAQDALKAERWKLIRIWWGDRRLRKSDDGDGNEVWKMGLDMSLM